MCPTEGPGIENTMGSPISSHSSTQEAAPFPPLAANTPSATPTTAQPPRPLVIDTATTKPQSDPRQLKSDSQLAATTARGSISVSPRDLSAASPYPLRRRVTNVHQRERAATFRTVEDYDNLDFDLDFDSGGGGAGCAGDGGGGMFSRQPGWQPGSEPGYDPLLPDGGHASMPALSAPCQITVIDFGEEHVEKRHFDNQGFIDYLERPKEAWAKCRWININGLSWDVIQAVGTKKGLHKLALEDIMNIRNRTKADWYPNHAFIVLTLQKLVHLVNTDDDTSSSSSIRSRKSFRDLRGSFMDMWRSKKAEKAEASAARSAAAAAAAAAAAGAGVAESDLEKDPLGPQSQPPVFVDGSSLPETSMLRTLQRYHASGNEARIEFMERHSSLAPYKMAVSAEQVSIFLTSDNTVISFFEVSAGDVERPIVTRLSTPGTILRQSYDGSLLVQAIIDAIIDLAIPLTAVYTDIIGDLELDVLTSPAMNQSKSLYICISEINKMLSFLNPIDNLMNVLRDHKTELSQEQAILELENPASGVIITPMTHTYLGDVLDHTIIVTETLTQLKRSSDNLINLIFNTISSGQNESMKQLTIVTIIFLPMTFITGFFGMNFQEAGFPDIHNGIWYFWACAVPTALATVLILMRSVIYDWIVRMFERQQVVSTRNRRRRRRKSFAGGGGGGGRGGGLRRRW